MAQSRQLLSFPPEILLDIITQLPVSSLSAFCRTCKAALNLAEPLLYRNISWRFGGTNSGNLNSDMGMESDDEDHEPRPEHHQIHSFMRTISQRPALASHVLTAELVSGIDSWGWSDPLPGCPAPPDVQQLWLECLHR